MSINQRIKELRKDNNISQVELAKALNISQGNVGDWERGKAKPGADAIIAIANYFNISTDSLLLGRDHVKYTSNDYSYMPVHEDSMNYSSDNFKLTKEEKLIILKHREGDLIIVDKVHHLLKGEVGELNELEMDLILKYRKIDPREQEDVYDNLCWRYEREHQKKISYESKIG